MTSLIVPPTRPKLTRDECAGHWQKAHVLLDAPALLGLRGYYRDTMGAPGENDIGLYDDAICLWTPTTFRTFNANTDPSRQHPGVATLLPGVWRYRLGVHGLSKPKPLQYRALVQAARVTVHRAAGANDTGWFGINIHRGSRTTTSSEGCQTIWPEQWAEFIDGVALALAREHATSIPYLLVEA